MHRHLGAVSVSFFSVYLLYWYKSTNTDAEVYTPCTGILGRYLSVLRDCVVSEEEQLAAADAVSQV
jgi:hypothetical protein